uniref:Putative WD-40 repeat-containing protein n=1 Tax=Coptotermes formosanus TaxID=36987 RepID=L0AV16_COPFO|nr:putative WD-40 repeat-containing protein [Coptotermes formosanus]
MATDAENAQTRFRFLQGQTDPPSEHWTNMSVANTANPQFNDLATNGKQFAWIGGGLPNAIYVVPLEKPFKLPYVYPSIQDAHVSQTSYLTFSPHRESLLATGGEDGKVRLWEVPPVLTENIKESVATFTLKRRIHVIKYSDAIDKLIAIATQAPELNLWDINREVSFRNFSDKVNNPIHDIEFSSLSDILFVVLNDGQLLQFDPRADGPAVASLVANPTGARNRRLLYCHDFNLLTSFALNNRNERQISVWDPRKFEKPLKSLEFDHNSGNFFPMYQEGSGIIFLGGKGETSIKFCEICADDRVIASSGSFDSTDQERGLCLVPSSFLNFMGCEVARVLKLGSDSLRAVRFTVPRQRKEFFQDDLYRTIRDTRNGLMQIVDWEKGNLDSFPTIDFCPPGKKKLSEAPKVQTKGKYDFKTEINKKKAEGFTIENVLENAPELSSSPFEKKKEDSDSW